MATDKKYKINVLIYMLILKPAKILYIIPKSFLPKRSIRDLLKKEQFFV